MKLTKKVVLLVPYPAQGHVTPMLKLASLLVNHGLNPILITPHFIHHNICTESGISSMSIEDGIEEGSPRDFFAIEKSMENKMPYEFEKLVCDQQDVCVIIYDLLASWVVKVADKCGIQVAGFWPAMLATYNLIHSIPCLLSSGIISETGCPLHKDHIISLGETILSPEDLPWLIGNSASRTSRFKFWIRTMEKAKTLKWLLINTFPDTCQQQQQPQFIAQVGLENGEIDSDFTDTMKIERLFSDACHKEQKIILNTQITKSMNYPQIIPIGPLNTHVTIKNSSFWEEDFSCLAWLDKQVANSVLYISFGSWVSPIGKEKVNSLALALEFTKKSFIWVLGASWREGLPRGYLERTSKQGKIVSWAPQMDVLQHEAVGCYLTHCGWNSTLEAIQSKKRLLCYPIAGDQFINCAHIVKKWRIGVRINGFGMKDLEKGLKKIVEDYEMSERIDKLNEMAMGKLASFKAIDNLATFISDVRI